MKQRECCERKFFQKDGILAKKYARHSADSSQSESSVWMNIKRQIRFYAMLPAKGRLIEKALEDGKRVALPRVTGQAEMHFYKITSMKDVASGYYDIPEPLENCQEEVFKGFLVVPGTAFDRQMHRMGYGGGSQVTACGLAYDFQLRNEIPFERHDRMMNIVITPDEVIRKGDAADDND